MQVPLNVKFVLLLCLITSLDRNGGWKLKIYLGQTGRPLFTVFYVVPISNL